MILQGNGGNSGEIWNNLEQAYFGQVRTRQKELIQVLIQHIVNFNNNVGPTL